MDKAAALASLADPKRSALVIVDMQNDFGHPDGYWSQKGVDVSSVAATMPGIAALIDAARAAGVMVTWTKNEALPGGRSDSAAWLAFKGGAFDRNSPAPTYTLKDSWGQEFMEPLAPEGDEPVVVKYRSSGFDHTALDLILRCNGIESVVLVGNATDACVEATARSAAYHDYFTHIVRDCVSSTRPKMHEDALHVFSTFFHLADSSEFISVWQNARA